MDDDAKQVISVVMNAAQQLFTNGHRPQYDDGVIDMVTALLGLEPKDRDVIRMGLKAVQSRDPVKIKQAVSVMRQRIEAEMLAEDAQQAADRMAPEADDDELR